MRRISPFRIDLSRRRFPVTDTETGATAGFILFGGGLPDVHMFKFDKDGRIYSIQAVFAGRVSPDTPTGRTRNRPGPDGTTRQHSATRSYRLGLMSRAGTAPGGRSLS